MEVSIVYNLLNEIQGAFGVVKWEYIWHGVTIIV